MNQEGASCLRDALALNLLLHCTWDLWVTLALWLRRLSWRSSSQRSRSSRWFQQHVPEFPGHPAWDGARSGASASSSCLHKCKTQSYTAQHLTKIQQTSPKSPVHRQLSRALPGRRLLVEKKKPSLADCGCLAANPRRPPRVVLPCTFAKNILIAN